MDINSVTTGGYSIDQGYTTSIGDTLTLGYNTASGDINISDADAKKIARYVWEYKLEDDTKAKEFMRLFAAVLGGKVEGMEVNAPQFSSPWDETKIRTQYVTDQNGNRIKQLIMDLD